MMPVMIFIAIAGFFCSLAVHIATFGPDNVASNFPMVFALHVGAMVTAASLMIANRDLRGKTKQESQRARNQAFARMPFYTKGVLICLTLYTAVNFGMMMITTESLKHAPAQTRAQGTPNSVLRGFSGHWMFFYLAPALMAMYRRPRRIH